MERVYTIDGISGKIICTEEANYCLLDYVHDHFIYGFTLTDCINTRLFDSNGWHDVCIPYSLKDHLIYHNGWGTKVLDFNLPLREIVAAKYEKGNGYPYSFSKKYEAIENFKIFENKQTVCEHKEFPISKYFKYTFGLEYETSVGIIPEDICFRDGLIPLRDGSISGNEYSTVVMAGNDGFNLLHQQLKTLRKISRLIFVSKVLLLVPFKKPLKLTLLVFSKILI